MILIKIVVSILVLISAIYMIIKGFAGEAVAPLLLGAIGILMIIEMVLDLVHH